MAPSWGTSCFRSSSLILSTESTRGERPPCTQRIAPVSFRRDPFAEDVAPVPAGPTRDGEGATGDDEPMFALSDATLDCESEFRA